MLLERLEKMSWTQRLTLLWALVAGIASVLMNIGVTGDGEIYGWTRIILGLLAVAGVVLILAGERTAKIGTYALLGWGALQLPYYATEEDGNFTRQVVDGLLGFTSSSTVNGVVTQYSAVGLNIVGIVVFALVYSFFRSSPFYRPRYYQPRVN